MSNVDPKRYKDFTKFNSHHNFIIIMLLGRPFISSLILNVSLVILTTISIWKLSVTYGASLSYISSHEYSRNNHIERSFDTLGLISFTMMLLIVILLSCFHVGYSDIIWSPKGLVFGRRTTVESRVVRGP